MSNSKIEWEVVTVELGHLYVEILTQYSGDGQTIADFYGGSGTAMIASENLGRQCRAVEISPVYCSVILQRYLDAFGIEPELVG